MDLFVIATASLLILNRLYCSLTTLLLMEKLGSSFLTIEEEYPFRIRIIG